MPYKEWNLFKNTDDAGYENLESINYFVRNVIINGLIFIFLFEKILFIFLENFAFEENLCSGVDLNLDSPNQEVSG